MQDETALRIAIALEAIAKSLDELAGTAMFTGETVTAAIEALAKDQPNE